MSGSWMNQPGLPGKKHQTCDFPLQHPHIIPSTSSLHLWCFQGCNCSSSHKGRETSTTRGLLATWVTKICHGKIRPPNKQPSGMWVYLVGVFLGCLLSTKRLPSLKLNNKFAPDNGWLQDQFPLGMSLRIFYRSQWLPALVVIENHPIVTSPKSNIARMMVWWA